MSPLFCFMVILQFRMLSSYDILLVTYAFLSIPDIVPIFCDHIINLKFFIVTDITVLRSLLNNCLMSQMVNNNILIATSRRYASILLPISQLDSRHALSTLGCICSRTKDQDIARQRSAIFGELVFLNGIGGSTRLRPCHPTRHAGPHRAVREVEVMRVEGNLKHQSSRL